ncbi:amino acid transporter [Pseudoclavibacter sp. AY1F1]|uniref:amino acid permease n=1 Tax=Pseudoclavibacter sp. AY1F1 TaxID=2080583 RepID=UPI000CE8E3F9|nr:amino acid permease [Pseudoclavibacter sp. AY1F1]PPF44796.1 amino acid transporter [Pseudoclavibacter sp. AY1F1]
MTTTKSTATPNSHEDALGAGRRLHQSLSPRQLTMMGLGGAIGAGLFIGSGQAIAVAGPAVLISYAVAGFLVILIMFMLAEMAANDPQSGAFSVFAEKAFGATAGATLGWLYWVQLVVVIAAEATGAAAIVAAWTPAVPQGVWAFVFMAGFTLVNLLGVRHYGSFEFWFAILKVAAIIIFLGIGAMMMFGLLPGVPSPGLGNLVEHGGFAPEGLLGISAALLVVMFTFGGTEIIAIASAESRDPAVSIRRAVRSVMWRILVFYIGSIFIIVACLPWNSETVAAGPFAAVLALTHIPGVDVIMSVVVVVALLSALNANLYGASRIIFSLSERRFAPGAVSRIAANGAPRVAVLCSVAFGFITVIFNFLAPETVLPTLLNIVGSTLVVLWATVTASQFVLRRRADARGEQLAARMPGFPVLTVLAGVLLAGIVTLTLFSAGAREQFLATVGLVAVIAVACALRQRVLAKRPESGVAAARIE